MTKHEAVEAVLKRAGKPLKTGQIVDHLRKHGYSPHLERRMLFNGVYTALKRKEDIFVEDDGKWGLSEWKAPE